MASLFAASCLLLVVVLSTLTCSGKKQEKQENPMCYCNCHAPAYNSSFAHYLISKFMERVENKLEELSHQQQRMMSELETRQEEMFSSLENITSRLHRQSTALEESPDTLEEEHLNAADLDNNTDMVVNQQRAGCPNNFHYDNNSQICIASYGYKSTWYEAKERCERFEVGGRLAVLDTPDKVLFAGNVSREYVGLHFWVGGCQLEDNGPWKWLTGQDVTEEWAADRPLNRAGHCLAQYGGQLYNFPCLYRNLAALCELVV